MFDVLTGLPARDLLLDRMRQANARARRHPRQLVVYAFAFEDSGDELILAISQLISDAVREMDTVSRLDDGRIIAFCEAVNDDEDLLAIAERFRGCGREAFEAAQVRTGLPLGIGVSRVRENRDDPPRAIQRAVDAADIAFQKGGEAFELDEELSALGNERVAAGQDLQIAIDEGGLRLHFQPIVSLTDRTVKTVEALLRWPKGDAVWPAGKIIAVAEQSGLSTELGAWTIDHAFTTLANWRRLPELSHMKVSVNIAPKHLATGRLDEHIAAASKRSGVDRDRLALEITEPVAAGLGPRAIDELREIAQSGVKITIDDFARAPSRLDLLRRLPVSALKIARSLVELIPDDNESTSIGQASIEAANALEIETIASGVESPGQLATFRELGCGFAQGFLFSVPMPPETLAHRARGR